MIPVKIHRNVYDRVLADPATWRQKVLDKSVADPVTGCWRWTGSVSPRVWHGANGRLSIDANYPAPARIAWLAFTEKPEPRPVHNCPLAVAGGFTCVNPAHLFAALPTPFPLQHLPPTTKLDPARVREIRRRYPAETMNELARAFGVTVANIFCIVNRRTWKYVD